MNKRKIQIIGVALVLASLLGLIGIPRSIPVTINGVTQFLNTNALTVSAALERDGLVLSEQDQVSPAVNSLLLGTNEIQIELARPVKIVVYPRNEEIELITAERSPAMLLEMAEVELGEKDQLLLAGQLIPVDQLLPYQGEYELFVRKAIAIDIDDVGENIQITSSAVTLGQALEENGIQINKGDRVIPDPDTILDGNLAVVIKRAQLYTIQLVDKTVEVESAGETVAEVLSEAGLSLQNLDYSIPDASDPVPADGNIRMVRVREEIILTQTDIPYTVDYIQSDEVELDKQDIVQPGEFGVEVTRTRVIYEDDEEVNRMEEVTWVAKDPVEQLNGLGTQVVVRTMDTPDGPIEYWRAVNVYATSYSPCRLGIENYCSSGTSSGMLTQKGVIAVTSAWYNLMVGQRLYVPGYGIGVVGDIGGGIDGRYWIDLAYSDDDYVPWYFNVTAYFLTPVPDYIPWILP